MGDGDRENSLHAAASLAGRALVILGLLDLFMRYVACPLHQACPKKRSGREHGSVPVPTQESEFNAGRLEFLFECAREDLARGQTAYEVWFADRCRGTSSGSHASMEALLDKSLVHTMNPKRYHEIEAWWDGIVAQAEDQETLEDSNKQNDIDAYEAGIWGESQSMAERMRPLLASVRSGVL